MASITKHGKGYRAAVARRGVRMTKVFPTKTEAKDWAARQEYLILNAQAVASGQPFGDVLERYAREVSPAKRGARWEQIRIERFRLDDIAKINIGDLRAADFAAWREARLKQVSPGTVRREMVLLSAVLTVARKEWGLIKESPLTDVRKPSSTPPRDRLVTDDELQRLAISAGADLTNSTARAFHAFLFAIETAMRAGEVIGLTWAHVDLESRVCHLPMTKNGTARDVPLSTEAVRLLRALPHADPVFGLSSRQIDALWRKLRDRAGVADLHFHDARHTAITRLSKKLDVLALARMVGHRNLSQLMAYYNETAADLAKRLD
jgi:integrase